MFTLILIFSTPFLIVFCLRLFLNSRGRNQAGPQSYPIIGCLISFYQNRRRLLDWYTALLSSSLSQTIVVHRLGGRRTIVTANPANVEYMLKTNFSNFPKGKPLTEILGDLLGFGIFNVDGELWSSQRKLASHEFSTRSLRECVMKTLEHEAEKRLIPLLDAACSSNEIIDLQDIFRRFAFDTICKVSLGTDPNCLDLTAPVPPLVKAFDGATEISAMRGMAPVYAIWKIKRRLRIGSEKKLKTCVEIVHESVEEIIRMKRKIISAAAGNGDDGGDLLSRLLAAGHGDEVVRDMVISFILAGRDTTSSAMTWLFYLFSKNRNYEKLILNELDAILDNQKLIGYEKLKEMKLVKACLCESMRLYPPVVWDSKHAAGDDMLPDGTAVRKGDRVTYFPYGMGRMEEIWGKDRFEFKPERWFVEPTVQGSGNLKFVSPFKFPVFQAGPRVCLGKEMAFVQMKYVVTSILRRFEIRPVSDESAVFVPLLTAHMLGGFKVLVRKRSGNSETLP